MTMVHETADAFRRAMASAGIESAADVHFAQVKCPLLTSERMADAHARGQSTVTEETYASMGYTRAASALGAALALGELSEEQITDDVINSDWSLFSGRASASAGVELLNCEIIVLGNSTKWAGNKVIAHDVMQDAVDAPAVWRAIEGAGLGSAPQLDDVARARLDAVLCKAGTGHDGRNPRQPPHHARRQRHQRDPACTRDRWRRGRRRCWPHGCFRVRRCGTSGPRRGWSGRGDSRPGKPPRWNFAARQLS